MLVLKDKLDFREKLEGRALVGDGAAGALLELMPLRSSRQAEFLPHEVSGIDIPKHVRERLAELGNEDAAKCGAEMAQNLLVEAKPLVGGLASCSRLRCPIWPGTSQKR